MMVPAAVLVLLGAVVLVIWGAAGHIGRDIDKDRTDTRITALEKQVNQRVDTLEKQVKALRDLLDDVIVGHVNEGRLKRVLSHILDE